MGSEMGELEKGLPVLGGHIGVLAGWWWDCASAKLRASPRESHQVAHAHMDSHSRGEALVKSCCRNVLGVTRRHTQRKEITKRLVPNGQEGLGHRPADGWTATVTTATTSVKPPFRPTILFGHDQIGRERRS